MRRANRARRPRARLGDLAASAKGAGKGADAPALIAAAALLGDRRARLARWQACTRDLEPRGDRGIGLRLGGGDPGDLRVLLDALRADPARHGDHADAVAAAGDPAHVEGLLETMASPAVARGAGLAFEILTGIEIRGALEARANEQSEQGGDADDADPMGDRPLPDRDAVAEAWRSRRTAFVAGRRYLLGAVPTEAQCRALLASDAAPRAHREAAALELVRIDPRHGFADVDAPRL